MEIHEHLRSIKEQVETGQIPLGKFVITKQLTKRPEDYPDAKGQPHVSVALRRKTAGKREGVGAGETVPYIICVNKAPPLATTDPTASPAPAAAAASGGGKTFAERAYHPEELRESGGLLAIDADYYLGQQGELSSSIPLIPAPSSPSLPFPHQSHNP